VIRFGDRISAESHVRFLAYELYGHNRTSRSRIGQGGELRPVCSELFGRGHVRLVSMTAQAAAGDRDDGPANVAAAAERAVNPLQRLIQGRLSERGWSYGDVARRGGLPRSTVYTLATTRNLVRPPRPATIDGLAKGLEVPVSAVRAAAAQSTGMHYYDEPAQGTGPGGPGAPGDQERELLIASIDELSAEDRRHVAALVESLRNRSAPPADR
jgi:transcriptional regulator with XRE-family HTH domain